MLKEKKIHSSLTSFKFKLKSKMILIGFIIYLQNIQQLINLYLQIIIIIIMIFFFSPFRYTLNNFIVFFSSFKNLIFLFWKIKKS